MFIKELNQSLTGFMMIFLCTQLLSCQTEENTAEGNGFYGPKQLGEVGYILEASGMVASRKNPDMIWIHNDSGAKAEIYLIDQKGVLKQTFKLKGVNLRDWEDIAIGPGPEKNQPYLYIGEIGDNNARFQQKIIYRFPEPEFSGGNDIIAIEIFDKIVFQYPDGKRDAETLLSDPFTGDLYIISKREENVHVYSLPYPQEIDTISLAIFHGTIPFHKISAGDISQDGREIIIKNYESIFYWCREEDQSVFEALTQPEKILPYKQEPQGESLAWMAGGKGYFTLSEKNSFEKVILYGYYRR